MARGMLCRSFWGVLSCAIMSASTSSAFSVQSLAPCKAFGAASTCTTSVVAAAGRVGRLPQLASWSRVGARGGVLSEISMVGGDGRVPNKPDLPKDFKRVFEGSTDFYQQTGVNYDEGDEDDEDEDSEDEDEEEDDISLSVRMDALRRMQQYKAKQAGQLDLQSGRIQYDDIPLEVDVREASRKLKKDLSGADGKKDDIYLLDVRERDEWDFCRLSGATLIPLSQMKERYDEVPKDKEVLVYCHHGMRSMQVVRYLRTRGWKRVTNIQGGIDEWSQAVDSSVPLY